VQQKIPPLFSAVEETQSAAGMTAEHHARPAEPTGITPTILPVSENHLLADLSSVHHVRGEQRQRCYFCSFPFGISNFIICNLQLWG
jgi:hypothetical protein